MGYEESEIVLEEGETALFNSDGLVEAHDPKGEMFGFPRLRALIAEHGDDERSLWDFLLEELYTFVGGAGSRRMTSPPLSYDAQSTPKLTFRDFCTADFVSTHAGEVAVAA
jgi:hypothetical protein